MTDRKNIYRKSVGDIFRSALVPIIFTIIVMGMILNGLRQTEKSSNQENRRILEESLRRAVVVNYSIYGNYPQSVVEIEEKYGIYIDRTRYVVHYSVFASNLMPDMAVFDIRPSTGAP